MRNAGSGEFKPLWSATHRALSRWWRSHRWLLATSLIFLLAACTDKAPDQGSESSAPPPPATELDLWAGVLEIVPAREPTHHTLNPTPGPDKPPQAGEVVELPFPAPGPVPDNPDVADSDPLSVERFGPVGDAQIVDAVRASFNHPMVPLASIDALKTESAPIRIEPAFPGHARWFGTRTLGVVAEGRIPFSTTYTVTVPAGTKSTGGSTLTKDVRWTFTTPALALESASPSDGSGGNGLEPTVTLVFNQPVQRTALLASLSWRARGKKIEFSALPQSATDKTDPDATWREARTVRLRAKAKLRPGTTYKISIPGGVFGEGPIRSSKITTSFSTYAPLKLSKSTCEGPCPPDTIRIRTSNTVADPKLAEKVHIKPEIADLSVSADYRTITLTGNIEGLKAYRVTVDAGLLDNHGQRLERPFATTIKTGPQRPVLAPPTYFQHPAIIERSAANQVQLRVAGLTELEVKGRALNLGEVYGFSRASLGDDSNWPPSAAPPEFDSTVDVKTSLRTRKTLAIDLGPILKPNRNVAGLVVRSNVFAEYGYNRRRTLQTIVEVTDIGVATALGPAGGGILVTGLATGKPLAAAKAAIVDEDGKELWSGTTDTYGLCEVSYPSGSATRALTVEHDDDRAILLLTSADARGERWRRTPQDDPRAFFFTERTPYKPGDTIHLSGILRRQTAGPNGGVAYFRKDVTATYTVHTPRGIEVAQGDIAISAFGTFTVDIPTEPDGDTGYYRFTLTTPALLGSGETFSHMVPVETYRAPEFSVTVERQASKPLVFGETLATEIKAEYLHGAPMSGADVRYTIRRARASFTPPGDANQTFAFGAHQDWWRSRSGGRNRSVTGGSGKIDAEGTFIVKHKLAAVDPPVDKPKATDDQPDPIVEAMTYTVAATVTDENRQAIAGSASFVAHPARAYVGIRSGRSVLRQGEQTRLEAIVVDLEGNRLIGRAIELDVVRRVTERTAVESGGRWTFEYKTHDEPITSCALTSAEDAVTCALTPAQAGTYVVTASGADADGNKTQSELQLFVLGKDALMWNKEKRRIDIIPDQRTYKPGDEARLLIRSPFDEARGFVVVEREGIVSKIPVTTQSGTATAVVKIDETMAPGVRVSAILARGRVEVAGAPSGQDLGLPAVATGELKLEVTPDHKRVFVELTPHATELEPKGTLSLSIATKDYQGKGTAAALAVFVVDEGVLSLMDYKTPDPLTFFHRTRAGHVRLDAIHRWVIPRRPNTSESEMMLLDDEDGIGEAFGVGGLGLVGRGGAASGAGYGGGSGIESRALRQTARPPSPAKVAEAKSEGGFNVAAGMAQPVSLRTLFATTAFFDANVRTDGSGTATIEIPMPENLTTFRVMAVAIDPSAEDRFGSGETSVRVRKPLMLRPSLPRFANLGDKFEAGVMVDNQTGADQTVVVGTRGHNVSFDGSTEHLVQIAAGQSKEVRFRMKTDAIGAMQLQFAAMCNAGRDATELSLPVNSPATAQAFADYGMTDASISRKIKPPKDALPSFGGLEVSMSSTALNGLEDAISYLVEYTYECAEQTASRVLPIFVLGKVLDEFPIAKTQDRGLREALARDGIDKLLRNQAYDGGFGYWSDQESWPYLTNWVTFALLEGQRAGFKVNEQSLDAAMNYVTEFVRDGRQTRWGGYYDWTSRAFGLWLLSSEKRGAELFDSVWRHRRQMPLYARALLMSAAHRYGRTAARDTVSEQLHKSVVETAKTIHFRESVSEGDADGLRVLMHSDVQTDAIALMALLEVNPKDPMLPKIMAGILDERDPRAGGRWATTHANAWALLAASRYYETVEADEPDMVAKIWVDGLFAGQQAFAGRSMTKVKQTVPMDVLADTNDEVRDLVLSKQGQGKLYYRLGLTYAPADLQLKAEDQGFVTYRTYQALTPAGQDPDPKAVVRLEDGSWQIKAGTNVKVTLQLVARDRANYVVVDDRLPAGFEGQNPRFRTSVEPDASTASTPSLRRWWYPWWRFSHTQMRDDRMLLFADHLPAGVYTYTYTARATTVGTFVLPPIKAEAMYQPERFGHSATSTVHVVD